MSDEKISGSGPDETYATHSEKENVAQGATGTTGRRQSVALNIVENPLKVSLHTIAPAKDHGLAEY